jgi:carbamoyl-phosphate synthase large subunit
MTLRNDISCRLSPNPQIQMSSSSVNPKPKTVLVTGAGGGSVGSGILHSLLRSSDEVRSRWRVVAADANPFAWGLYKADAAVLLPLAKSADYVSAVKSVIAEHSVDAVIPGTEVEIRPLLQNAAELSPAVIIANRLELLPLMLDKFAATASLKRLGYAVIPTAPVAEWRSIADSHGFPLIVKPTHETSGSRGLYFIRDEREILRLLPLLNDETKSCVQPYIGDPDAEYTVGVLSDTSGKLIDSIVMRRKLIGFSLHTSRPIADRHFALSTGYSQGYIIRDTRIQSFCERLASQLDSRGPLNIQLRIDPVTGNPLVFEIHPRFSGTTPIRADVGFNEVDVLLRNVLFGESFGRLGYRTNVAAIRAFEHVIVPMDNLLR